jgi:methionine sulfoxide reductase heme-binding subunit
LRGSVRKATKVVLFAAALVPAALLLRGLLGYADLGANPAETIQLHTGRWAFKFLLITLAITPLRRLTKWNVLIQYRRMLGLFAFFYACLHFLAYWAFDLTFSFGNILKDVAKRPFILMGMVALLSMLPLAITSTKGWIRRLGKRWTMLHRLIYVSAIAAAIHFGWKVKVFSGDPVWYAAAVVVLLGFRLAWMVWHSRAKALRYRPETGPA